jgi:hypothetical protein
MLCNQNHRNWIVKIIPLFTGSYSWTFNLANDKIDNGHEICVLIILITIVVRKSKVLLLFFGQKVQTISIW